MFCRYNVLALDGRTINQSKARPCAMVVAELFAHRKPQIYRSFDADWYNPIPGPNIRM